MTLVLLQRLNSLALLHVTKRMFLVALVRFPLLTSVIVLKACLVHHRSATCTAKLPLSRFSSLKESLWVTTAVLHAPPSFLYPGFLP